jgi:hypothetical protein
LEEKPCEFNENGASQIGQKNAWAIMAEKDKGTEQEETGNHNQLGQLVQMATRETGNCRVQSDQKYL